MERLNFFEGSMNREDKNLRIAVLGHGDIGQRLLTRLQGKASGYAFSRSEKVLPEGFRWHQADTRDVESYGACLPELDALLITLTPFDRGDEAYRLSYVEPIRQLVEFGKTLARCPLLMFVSSTAVYGQNDGSRLSDDSPTEPQQYNGIRMLEAEQLLADSGLPHCRVRFSGIYGPERKRLFHKLVDEVQQGGQYTDADAHWGNRIHVEDCAGVLEHILNLPEAQRENMYLATDTEPVLRGQLKAYLATQLSAEGLPEFQCDAASGKQLFPERLLRSEYSYRYPSYRKGYQAQLAALK
ncbi:NAD-dependent epimerase/dehydratase family protein [Pseudoteredinibacter isoporae]|uniref:NAD-dependent epimerase/dehydratase family protein n=1 Tax=Pseudoteredinibacter isoporae TaxID=570281 RepID=UPI00310AC434